MHGEDGGARPRRPPAERERRAPRPPFTRPPAERMSTAHAGGGEDRLVAWSDDADEQEDLARAGDRRARRGLVRRERRRGAASERTRAKYTTHGLDYLHARQGADAGFTNPENTAWAILGMIAKRERQGTSAWRVKGTTPFQYLQKSDLAASAASGSDNAPVYYSRLIMAFVAARQGNQVATAGSKSINLLTELWKYQDMSDTSREQGRLLRPARHHELRHPQHRLGHPRDVQPRGRPHFRRALPGREDLAREPAE